MRAHRVVARLAAALVLLGIGNARAARLNDEQLKRLLESVADDAAACAGGSLEGLEAAARTLRERFDEKHPASEEALRFLLEARSIPESENAACVRLRDEAARLATAYHVDRSMDAALWRARRMNDAELAELLGTLSGETVPFASELEKVVPLLDPCTVVEGEREEAVDRTKALGRAAAGLRKAVEKDRDPDEALETLLSEAAEVRRFLERHSITRVLRESWGPIERDLSLVRTAFGVRAPEP